MLCGLATLVTVPVVLSSGASSDGEEIAAIVVPETVTASQLEADVDIDELFAAGAKLDDVSEMPTVDPSADASLAAEAVAAAPHIVVGTPQAAPRPDTESVEAATTAAPVTSTTTAAPEPLTPQPTTPPVTAAPAPTTAAPTTAAPTTAAPTTAAPTTVPPADELVAEAPQSAEPESLAPSTPTPEQWAALRQCEASGNYSIVSSNGRYHGAYQFYQPTWDGLAQQLGRTDLVGLAPSQAAPADQDALALLLWQQRGNQPWPHCGRHLPAGP